MARRKSVTLTEVELEFMHILWELEEAAPEDLRTALIEQGRTLTGGSVRKMLSILMKKGFVTRKRLGKKYIYSAHVPQEQAKGSIIHELLDRTFGGSASLMFATLLESRDIPDEDVKKIEQLIAERKKEARK
ncbi:BlaI/MecI/CopY family transcriptional regulator [Candidatus Omnitrophota bacterium]